ncbi:outer membrane protein [Helicobacter cetorum]|uniref:outer membrane protein n=1 Tax=Helicobacter cetorum TaxID=138563 RepID=UPI001F26F579|nr:outer membrane protein [Helicobacter cetorum]
MIKRERERERERERVKGVVLKTNSLRAYRLSKLFFAKDLCLKKHLKIVSRSIFYFLVLDLSLLKAHEKNGFFIEGGFETGMLQGTEKREQQIITEHKTYEDYLPLKTIINKANNLFADSNAISKLQFSTLHPIKVSLDRATKQLVIENFLPYNVNNVKLSFKDSQGRVVDLGMVEMIPKLSKITLSENLFDNFKEIDPNATYNNFEVSSTKFSDESTQRLFRALDIITTDLVVEYKSPPTFNSCQYHKQAGNNKCYSPFTSQTAEEFTNLLINMYAVLDSKSWYENIMNAPFDFTNVGGDCKFGASKCVAPGKNGLAPNGKEKNIVPHEKVVADFRSKMNLQISILQNAWVDGLGMGGVTWGKLGVIAGALDPKQLFGNDYKNINLGKLRAILHEFSHTKSYSHNGNMTYQRVPKDNGKGDSDGIPYNVCSRFGGEGQPAYPGHFQDSVYPNCNDVPAGFLGITTSVWQQLLNQNALPIDFSNLSNQKNYLDAKLNTTSLANSMLSTLKESFLVSSTTTTSMSISGQRFNTVMLGANLKLGYQQYFNDYLGLAYYGIAKYNFSNSMGKKVQQMGFGGGVELLIEFITSYDNKKPLKSQLTPKRLFKSSFGMFAGLRGLYNNYHFFSQIHNRGNLNFTSGLNYRYRHSKYSVGISIPLIEQNIKVSLRDSNIQRTFILKEGASHFNVFFNYGWVF